MTSFFASFQTARGDGYWRPVALSRGAASLARVSRCMRRVYAHGRGVLVGLAVAVAGLAIARGCALAAAVAAALALLSVTALFDRSVRRQPPLVGGGKGEAESTPDDDSNAFGISKEEGSAVDKGGGGGLRGSGGALDVVHERHAADATRRPQRPGLAKVRTENSRISEGFALANTLDGRPWSRRRLADAIGVAESIVRRWCTGEKPIQGERLKDACPVVWNRWQARLAVIAGERSAG